MVGCKQDNAGRTPLYHACCHERESTISYFVQHLGVTIDTMVMSAAEIYVV